MGIGFRGSSCLPCRQTKRKCNHELPCLSCKKAGREDLCLKYPPSRAHKTSGKITFSAKFRATKLIPSKGTPIADQSSQCCFADLSLTQTLQSLKTLQPINFDLLQVLYHLPTRHQTDGLVDNFFTYFGHMYITVHPQWFYNYYDSFWNDSLLKTDPFFASLVFAILCVSTQEISEARCKYLSLDVQSTHRSSSDYYRCFIRCLHIGNYKDNHSIVSLMSLSVIQSYLYSTKMMKPLLQFLPDRMKIAKGLKLHLVGEEFSFIAEQSRRVWWDIVTCDGYQAICQYIKPLIDQKLYDLPLPTNCNDIEMDFKENRIHSRSSTEITEVSGNIIQIKFLKLCRKLWHDHGSYYNDPAVVISLDKEINMFIENENYFKLIKKFLANLSPNKKAEYFSSYHITWTCIQTQRIRMHRAFLNPPIKYSLDACMDAGSSILSVYHQFRLLDWSIFKEWMLIQAHNLFSAAIAQVIFMIVEKPPTSDQLRNDAKTVLRDLQLIRFSKIETEVVKEGILVLHKLLELDDALQSISSESSSLMEAIPILAQKIRDIFGGNIQPDNYMNRLSINFLIKQLESVPETDLPKFSPRANDWLVQHPWETWTINDWLTKVKD
ncbi:hypothetical protein KL931_004439 [Ogataea haglerorum]|nr:hypothetical protein KL931_004439 [Ogataea haglerorum]